MNELTQSQDLLKHLADFSSEESASDTNDTPATDSKKSTYRTVFISDVHMGTKDCKSEYLLEFFKYNSFDQLYLVGDIFDGWKMKSGIYWHKSFNKLIRRLLKLTKKGKPVYYITGNHDEFLRKYANTKFDKIHLLNRATHETAQGKKLLIIHGDQFESVTHCSKFLKYVGDKGYDVLMKINRAANRIRAKYGYGYWSFAAFLKEHVQTAKDYILRYEQAVAHGAKKQGFDGVICGHIHQAAAKNIEGIEYYNTGDWVESCTAIVETHSGELKLIDWLNDRSAIIKASKREKKQRKPHTARPQLDPTLEPLDA